MDNTIHIEELTNEQITGLSQDSSPLSDLIFSNSDDWDESDRIAMSNHNGWQIIHYLLSGDAWDGKWPLSFMGSLKVGTPVMYDEEYPPAKLFSAEDVQVISKSLQTLSADDLTSRFNQNAKGLDEFDCACDQFESPDVFLQEMVAPDYEEIKSFVLHAANSDKGLLVAWTMM